MTMITPRWLAVVVAVMVPALGCAGDAEGTGRSSGSGRTHDGDLVEAMSHTPQGAAGADPVRFTCAVAGHEVEVSKDGRTRWSRADGARGEAVIPSAFDKVQEWFILRAWCGRVGKDLLILHQSTFFGPDGDFTGGAVARVDLVSGLVKWSTATAGNTGDPLRSGGNLYVTGMGFVGKLDLETGRHRPQAVPGAPRPTERSRAFGRVTRTDRRARSVTPPSAHSVNLEAVAREDVLAVCVRGEASQGRQRFGPRGAEEDA